jgi:hypothetical protein
MTHSLKRLCHDVSRDSLSILEVQKSNPYFLYVRYWFLIFFCLVIELLEFKMYSCHCENSY